MALTVSPAEATTSAVGSLTSGGDHLRTNDSGHLHTSVVPANGGRPSARKEVLAPVLAAGVRTRPSKNTDVAPAAYDVLYRPLSAAAGAGKAVDVADRRTVRPSPVRWTGSHAPTKRQEAASEATPRPSKPGNRARGVRRHPQSAGPAYPKFASSARLANALLPRMLEEEAGR